MSTNRFLIICLLFFCSFYSSEVFSQSFKERFSVSLVNNFNIENYDGDYDPASYSIGIEPRFFCHDLLTVGLEYEHGLFALGRRGRRSASVFTGDLGYIEPESELKFVNQAGAKIYITPTVLNTKIWMGVGSHYYWLRSWENEYYDFSGNVVKEKTEVLRKFRNSVFLGFQFDRLRIGYEVNFSKDNSPLYYDMPNYSSFSIAYSICQNKIDEEKNSNNEILPFLTVGLGTEIKLPFSERATAPAWNYYLEGKLFLLQYFSIGYRFNPFNVEPLGADKASEDDWLVRCCSGFSNDAKYISWVRENRLEELKSEILNAEFYIPNKKGWTTIGVGIGNYDMKKLRDRKGEDFLGNEKVIQINDAAKNIGLVLNAGMKTPLFKSKLEIHFTGDGIPNYIAIGTGVEIGVPKFWK